MTQMFQRQREIVFYDSVNVANTVALNSNRISLGLLLLLLLLLDFDNLCAYKNT